MSAAPIDNVLAHFYITHEPIHFLSDNALTSVTDCLCHINSIDQAHLAFKGMRDNTLIGLFLVKPTQHTYN